MYINICVRFSTLRRLWSNNESNMEYLTKSYNHIVKAYDHYGIIIPVISYQSPIIWRRAETTRRQDDDEDSKQPRTQADVARDKITRKVFPTSITLNTHNAPPSHLALAHGGGAPAPGCARRNHLTHTGGGGVTPCASARWRQRRFQAIRTPRKQISHEDLPHSYKTSGYWPCSGASARVLGSSSSCRRCAVPLCRIIAQARGFQMYRGQWLIDCKCTADSKYIQAHWFVTPSVSMTIDS
jgi:hypothetical protein